MLTRGSRVLVLAAVVAACGGGSDAGPGVTPPPPPAPAPGPPASIAAQTGDGQQGAPGSAVSVTPSVIVKDASGRPVPGVAVTFTIDSGGGHVASSSAATDASGTASSGTWTLGPTEGSNVLVASVAGAGSVKVRAIAQFADLVMADVVIPLGGGTIPYSKPGDPLDGFSLTVAPGAYSRSQAWRVVARRGLRVELPRASRRSVAWGQRKFRQA